MKSSINESLKMIKNTFPNKIGNPKNLKKYSYHLGISPTNVYIVGEDLLGVLCKLLYLQFCISSDHWQGTLYQSVY